MAKKRNRNPNKRKRSGPHVSGDPRIRRAPAPQAALKPLLRILDDVVLAAQRSLLSTPNTSEQLVIFDIQVLNRGMNSLKAVRTLLVQGHWEYAVGVTRQLFELLVNMEYLGTLADRSEATLQFARFGLLQFVLGEQRLLLYDKERGRPFNPEKLAFIERLLEASFNDFRARTKDGSIKWVGSWCRKSTYDLSALSTESMRPHQYNLLYRVWSEQAHAAPGALIGDIFRVGVGDWVDEEIAENERWSKDTIRFAVAFFLKLWMELPYVKKSLESMQGWLAELNREFGDPELGKPGLAGATGSQ